jgi:YycE-like C-terminal domain
MPPGTLNSSATQTAKHQPRRPRKICWFYLDGPVDEDVVRRLVDAGGTQVLARNPYWDRGGVTIADPDGYRLVLTSRSWP